MHLNEEVIQVEIKELVRDSVEGTLNELLDTETEKLTQAVDTSAISNSRVGYRSDYYIHSLITTFGNVTLEVSKLKEISFETVIIERYRCRESSVEEALIKMYLADVSVQRSGG